MNKSGVVLGLLALVAIVVAVVSFEPAEKKEKVVVADKTKVGFVYVGPVADAGWTYEHDRGRLAVEKEHGGKRSRRYLSKMSPRVQTRSG